MALTKSQYDAIMREYDQLQAQHHYELEKRTEEIFEKIPEYKELSDSVATLGFSYLMKSHYTSKISF